MVSPRVIRAFIVSSSAASAGRLKSDLARNEQLSVVAPSNGDDVLDKLKRYNPDIVIVDWQPPAEAVCHTIRRIMASHPLPVVVVGDGGADAGAHFAAIEAGAVAMAERPAEMAGPSRDAQVAALIQTLQIMSEVRVVRRRPRLSSSAKAPSVSPVESVPQTSSGIQIVAIGASTGGPAVLHTIFRALPPDFSLPIVVVQHIGSGFLDGMLRWLQETTPLHLHVACPDEPLLPGHIYFAGDRQMAVAAGRIVVGSRESEDGHCPSVSYLFRSVARAYGSSAIGVLLTGMGKDGADGLWQMRQQDAVTIAQDRESCVVYGMPGAAEALGAAACFLPADRIGPTLLTLSKQKPHPARYEGLVNHQG